MRYGILGDIHANLSALRLVLERFDQEGVQQALSVGDVVGYGAAPRECIALVRERGTLVVKGNHDAACVGELDDRYFNAYARDALRWTRAALTRDDHRWLGSLPLGLATEHCQVAHGCVARPAEFNYVQTPLDADPSLDVMERSVAFVGHTHVPIALVRLFDHPGRTAYTFDTEIDVGSYQHSLVNVGSVGQPRDEDARTAYAIYDSDLGKVWIRRVDYDIDCEASRIRAAGLPGMLADRLYLGV